MYQVNSPLTSTGFFTMRGSFSFAIAVTIDKLLANVVNALWAFSRGNKGIVLRPSIAQSVQVFGPFNLERKIPFYIHNKTKQNQTINKNKTKRTKKRQQNKKNNSFFQ